MLIMTSSGPIKKSRWEKVKSCCKNNVKRLIFALAPLTILPQVGRSQDLPPSDFQPQAIERSPEEEFYRQQSQDEEEEFYRLQSQQQQRYRLQSQQQQRYAQESQQQQLYYPQGSQQQQLYRLQRQQQQRYPQGSQQQQLYAQESQQQQRYAQESQQRYAQESQQRYAQESQQRYAQESQQQQLYPQESQQQQLYPQESQQQQLYLQQIADHKRLFNEIVEAKIEDEKSHVMCRFRGPAFDIPKFDNKVGLYLELPVKQFLWNFRYAPLPYTEKETFKELISIGEDFNRTLTAINDFTEVRKAELGSNKIKGLVVVNKTAILMSRGSRMENKMYFIVPIPRTRGTFFIVRLLFIVDEFEVTKVVQTPEDEFYQIDPTVEYVYDRDILRKKSWF